ncbi:MAG TPA: DUF1828 domain-containing protein [Thermoanaerobaculia bacterium]|nr:DUF1828 domain-containing protein [Thermoanaerobaculia bacterium]
MIDTIERDFREKVCESLRLVPEGYERFRVFTPFALDDGDHLSIILKHDDSDGDRWVLSDEGHTYMHLTYDLEERSLSSGTRQKIIGKALTVHGLQDRNGELLIPVEQGRYGDALYSFIQALLRISDVTLLSRERVHAAFVEDLKAFLVDHIPERHRTFDWHHPRLDPDGTYSVDCYINSDVKQPTAVFGLITDAKVSVATISLMKFEQWGLGIRSIGVFEDQESISRSALARFTDVCDRMFSSLAANRDRLEAHISELLPPSPERGSQAAS